MEILKTEEVGTPWITNNLSWKFDAMYRLTNEVSISSLSAGTYTNAFQYDKVGNRLLQTRYRAGTVTTTAGQFDDNDRLLTETISTNGVPTGTNLFGYDPNGSLVARTNISGSSTAIALYGYDLKNKMMSVAAYNGSWTTNTFVYNYEGIRVRSTVVGGGTTYYLIDGNNATGYQQILGEFTSLGSLPSRSYVIGDDVLAQSGSGTASYLLYDGHGSTRQLAGSSAAVTSRYNFEAYGSTVNGSSSGTPETSLLYCGEQFDSTLGIYNLRARFYDPSNGRFNARDSFGGYNEDPQSLHKYLYVHDDPVNGADPSGLMEMVEILVVAGIVGILAAATGVALAAEAGKSKIRGALAGAALGAGVGIALATGRLPYAFAEGVCSATLLVLIDLAYEHFFEPGEPNTSLRFDMFEAFSWAVLDSSLDNPNGIALHDSTKTYALNLAQAFVNFTSGESRDTRMKDLLKEIGYALASYVVNASLDMMTQGLAVKVPPWLMKELGPKLEKLAVHGAEHLVEWVVSRAEDALPELLKNSTQKVDESQLTRE